MFTRSFLIVNNAHLNVLQIFLDFKMLTLQCQQASLEIHFYISVLLIQGEDFIKTTSLGD